MGDDKESERDPLIPGSLEDASTANGAKSLSTIPDDFFVQVWRDDEPRRQLGAVCIGLAMFSIISVGIYLAMAGPVQKTIDLLARLGVSGFTLIGGALLLKVGSELSFNSYLLHHQRMTKAKNPKKGAEINAELLKTLTEAIKKLPGMS